MGVEMARLHAVGDKEGLIKLFRSASRLTVGMTGFLGGAMMVVAEPFTRLWTHGDVTYSSLLILIFVATIAAVAPSQPAFSLFHYLNRPRVLLLTSAGQAAATMGLCFAFVKAWSDVGAALGTGIPEVFFIGMCIPVAAYGVIEVPIRFYVSQSIVGLAIALAVGFLIACLIRQAMALDTLLQFFEFGAIWLVAVSLPAFFLLFTSEVREFICQRLRAGTSRVTARLRIGRVCARRHVGEKHSRNQNSNSAAVDRTPFRPDR